MADTKLWLVARLDDSGDMTLSIAGSSTYMDDDPIHRTRGATITIDVLDETALNSARAMLVRVPPDLPGYEEARESAMKVRADSIHALTEEEHTELTDILQDVLDKYKPVLMQLLGRAASRAQDAAYNRDVYDADGKPIIDPRMPRVTFSPGPGSDEQ